MPGAWGPVEFSGAEVALGLTLFALVPPFMIAVVGSVVHALALLLAQQGDEVVLLSLFLKWWLWCTAGWIAAWLLGVAFG